MSMVRPDFIDSPYFVLETNNWHLKPGAPEDVKKEFEEYMEAYNQSHHVDAAKKMPSQP